MKIRVLYSPLSKKIVLCISVTYNKNVKIISYLNLISYLVLEILEFKKSQKIVLTEFWKSKKKILASSFCFVLKNRMRVKIIHPYLHHKNIVTEIQREVFSVIRVGGGGGGGVTNPHVFLRKKSFNLFFHIFY